MAEKFGVFEKRSNIKVFECHANSEADALDAFSQYRSGYETFSRMAVSATFGPVCDVWAYPIS